jgi:hypothetical protein
MALAVDVVIGSAFFWRYSMMMTTTKAMMIDTNGIVMPQTIAVILYVVQVQVLQVVVGQEEVLLVTSTA